MLPNELLTPVGIGTVAVLIVAGLKRLKTGKVGKPVGDFVREYTTLVSLVLTGILSLAAWLLVRYDAGDVVQEFWAWFVAAWLVNQTAYNVQKAATNRLN